MKKIIVTTVVVVFSMVVAMAQKTSDKNASNLTVGAFVGLNIDRKSVV